MQTEIVEDFHKIVDALKSQDVVGIPTETVYGLAADMFSQKAIKNIYKIKVRSKNKPLVVNVSSFNQALNLSEGFTNLAKELALKFWPGPLTIVLQKSKLLPEIFGIDLNLVAIRFSSNILVRKVVDSLKNPIVLTSANISGKPSFTDASQVFKNFKGKISAILKSKEPCSGVESTVVLFKRNSFPRILRLGAISKNDIENVIGKISNEIF
ncbi:MAG: threonylcarbamoyl-AMP synthase [Oscillospiraceae bacterium]|jgi:L-threonylcarbamoyladenylate synthase|nr:threonylcarbamoyl-AMP synthase [Oscillospiraceae bacterium]